MNVTMRSSVEIRFESDFFLLFFLKTKKLFTFTFVMQSYLITPTLAFDLRDL